MRITAIKQQVKDANRASIFVDGKYCFSLTLDQLIEEKLKNGLELNGSEVTSLKKKSADGKLRNRVIEWLSIRPRSEKELRLYLLKKTVESDHAEKLIEDMGNKKYFSDETFGRWYAGVMARSLKSSKEMSYSLSQKGLKSHLITELLSEYRDSEVERLKSIIEKKRHVSRFKDNDKLMAYLVRKGYSFSEVKEAIAEG